LKKIVKITYVNTLNKEGAGSLYQRELFAYLYAKLKGYSYVRVKNEYFLGHEPIDANQYSVQNEWEQFFGFFGDFVGELNSFLDIRREEDFDSRSKYLNSLDFNFSYESIASLKPLVRANLIRDLRATAIETIGKASLISLIKIKEPYLGVHIRNQSKGDVVVGLAGLPWQYFNVDYGLRNQNPIFYSRLYAAMIQHACLENKLNRVRIYSVGSENDFIYLRSLLPLTLNLEILLNRDSFSDFQELVGASAMIMSHSSFSWLATFFNSGPCYVREGFRHFLPPNVTVIRDQIVPGFNDLIRRWSEIQLLIRRIFGRFK
jgi:hypothetical protein